MMLKKRQREARKGLGFLEDPDQPYGGWCREGGRFGNVLEGPSGEMQWFTESLQ